MDNLYEDVTNDGEFSMSYDAYLDRQRQDFEDMQEELRQENPEEWDRLQSKAEDEYVAWQER